LDPVELDRTLDGELPADELAARRAWIEADPARRARATERAAFLRALRRAGEGGHAAPAGLEARVRGALEAARRPAPVGLRWAAAVAAVIVAGVLVGRALDGGPEAEAMPAAVLQAAEAARAEPSGPRTCEDGDGPRPRDFPPVRDGALLVLRCVTRDGGTVARLYRPEDLPSVGYVAVADRDAAPGPDIGMTDLGEMVVFDVPYGRQRHYLAVPRTFLDAQRARTPGRESCVACHNRSRDGQANPHNIVKRSWQVR
jgi:hypothetical protein